MSLSGLAPLTLQATAQPVPVPAASQAIPKHAMSLPKPDSMTTSLSTLDSNILRKIFSFVPQGRDSQAIPCVCKAWHTIISGAGQTPERALNFLVDRITIFASEDHNQDNAVIRHLKSLSVKPKRITFLENGSAFERPKDHYYSLEEFPHDHATSLNPVIQLVTEHSLSREYYYHFLYFAPPSKKKEHFDNLIVGYTQLIMFLYQDLYFRKIVLNENFKTYNPHKLGLDKAIPWKDRHPEANPKQTTFLKNLQLFFRKMDEELPKVPLSERETCFQRTVMEKTKYYSTLVEMDMSILFTIVEYAAIAKTTVISTKLKEKAPFNVNLLFDIFYTYPGNVSKDERMKVREELNKKLFEILNGFHRSTFMARKVVSKLQLLGKKEGMNLKDRSVFIYVGIAHLDILKEQLSACSHTPIQIKDPAKEAKAIALEVQKMNRLVYNRQPRRRQRKSLEAYACQRGSPLEK